MPDSPLTMPLCPGQSRLHKGKRGFTIIELLVVVAIIGTLAAIAIPAYYRYIDSAKLTLAISTLDTIRKDFESYQTDYQGYPPEPIDVNGIDGAGRTAFSTALLKQISNDIILVSYNSAAGNATYTLTAKARNKAQTQLTLTPTEIIKAP